MLVVWLGFYSFKDWACLTTIGLLKAAPTDNNLNLKETKNAQDENKERREKALQNYRLRQSCRRTGREAPRHDQANPQVHQKRPRRRGPRRWRCAHHQEIYALWA